MPPTPTPAPLPSPTVVVNLPADVLSKLTQHDPSPNWAEVWTCFGTWGLVIAAVVAGGFTLRQIVLARRSERGQSYWEVSRRWNDALFREARIRIRKFYESNNEEATKVTEELLALKRINEKQYWECLMALDFFETLAMSVKYKSITFDMVDDVFGFAVCKYWAMLFDFVKHQQEEEPEAKVKKYYVEFGKLADTIALKNDYSRSWQKDVAPASIR